MRRGVALAEAWRWDPDADGCGTEYSGAWAEADGDGQPEIMARWYSYIGPCITPSDHADLAGENKALRAEVAALREAAALVQGKIVEQWEPIPYTPGDPQPRISEGIYRGIRTDGRGGFEGIRARLPNHQN